MPAVNADTLTLPRIPVSTLGDVERPVRSVTSGPRGFEGEGFPVVRAFAGVAKRDLDPFVHMDQMGEVDYAPGEPKGTNWHPHRGFETVTYIIEGTFEHQDSHGGGGVIENGATQWMTAGAGILHEEFHSAEFTRNGGAMEMVQLWVNLPARHKLAAPGYQTILATDIPSVALSNDAGTLRVIRHTTPTGGWPELRIEENRSAVRALLPALILAAQFGPRTETLDLDALPLADARPFDGKEVVVLVTAASPFTPGASMGSS